jgi:hypothetical protein
LRILDGIVVCDKLALGCKSVEGVPMREEEPGFIMSEEESEVGCSTGSDGN